MTVNEGLKNLIWLLFCNRTPQASFYPGPQYVDLGGADNYTKELQKVYSSSYVIARDEMPDLK